MKWPFVVILSGPPAVGKSTVAQRFCRQFPLRIAEIDLDQVKLFVPGAPSTDFFLDLASQVGQSMLPCYLDAQISVIVHKAFCSFKFVAPFMQICEYAGVDYAYFKFTAPMEELLVRNRARLYRSNEEDLMRIFEFGEKCAHPQGITIDTMTAGVDEIVRHIVEYVQATDFKSP